MFLQEAILARVASALRPWMEEDPRFELELGFMRSRATARDLLLKASSLNSLLDESSALCFESVSIGGVVVDFSPLSSPLLKIEARGVRFDLKFRGNDRLRRSGCSVEARKKERIASLDPEGISLHNALENILEARKRGSRVIDSLIAVILGHCQMWFCDVDFQIHIPVDRRGPVQTGSWNDLHYLCLSIGEFNAKGKLTGYYKLLKGIVGVLVMGRDVAHLVFNFKDLYVKLKRREQICLTSCILSIRSIFLSVGMKKLQPLEFEIEIPEVDMGLSNEDLAVIIVAHAMLNTNNSIMLFEDVRRCPRNGKMLWKKAACQMHNLLPRFSLLRLISLVLLWRHYVQIYESLLQETGYPAGALFSATRSRLSKDAKFSNHIQHLWKEAIAMENKLPAEGVALARRVARHRSTVSSHVTAEPLDVVWIAFSSVVPAFIVVLVKGIGFVLRLFICVLHKIICAFCLYRFVWNGFLRWALQNQVHQLSSGGSVCAIENFVLVEGKRRIVVNLLKLVINVLSGNLPHAGIVESSTKPFPVDLFAFCIVLNQLYLDFAVDDNMQHLMFACGELVSHSYSSRVQQGLNARPEKVNPDKIYGMDKGQRSDQALDTILSSSPAVQIPVVELDSLVDSEGSVSPVYMEFLKSHIDEIYVEWKKSWGFSKLKHTLPLDKPFILCRLKSFIINPNSSTPNIGFLKLGISMGKLTFKVNISLLIRIYSQFIQLADHASCIANAISLGATLSSSYNREPQTGVDFKHQDFYADKVKMGISRIVFDKKIEIGAAIVGPRILVLFPDEDSLISRKQETGPVRATGLGCTTIAVDLKDIHFVVWPVSISVLTAAEEEGGNRSGICHGWLKKPPVVHLPEVAANESFIIQGKLGHNLFMKIEGLSFFLESASENHQNYILKPVSVTIESSSCRKYLHSLTSVATVLSMTLVCMTTDLMISLCMDELEEVLRVVGGSFNAVSDVSSVHILSNRDNCLHWISPSQSALNEEHKCAAMKYERKFDCFNIGTNFVIDVILEFQPLDIILNNSTSFVRHTPVAAATRKPREQMLVFPNTAVKFCIKKSRLSFFWEEQVSVCFLLDLAGIRFLIFGSRMKSPCEMLSMKNECSDEKNESSDDVLCEQSLPSCRFSLQSGIKSHVLSSEVDAEENIVSSTRLSGSNLCTVRSPYLRFSTNEQSVNGYYGSDLNLDSSLRLSWLPSSTCWFLVHVQLSEFFMVENSAKILDLIQSGNRSDLNKLEALFAVSKGCHEISLEVLGGLCFLETKSLVVYASCLRAYTLFFSRLFSYIPFWEEVSPRKSSLTMGTSKYLNQSASLPLQLNRESPEDAGSIAASSSDIVSTLVETGWNSLEVVTIRLSQISIKFIIVDASVGTHELDIETDFLLKYENNSRRNFFFDLSRLAILGLHWHRSDNYMEVGIQVPRFRSSVLNKTEVVVGSRQPAHAFQASETSSSDCRYPGNKLLSNSEDFCFYSLNGQNLILKCMTALIMVDKDLPGITLGSMESKNGWGGNASVSGLDLKVTISEIQLLLTLIEDLHNVFSHGSNQISEEEANNTILRGDDSLGDKICNGAVVAIKDLDQHMYLTVESVENTHQLVGTSHYSLVGERALFRVHCCTQRKGFSSVSCFSLISLYAKNDMGEPLRVNFNPKSNFVDISATDDKGGTLWQAIPYRPSSYEGNDELETYCHSMGRAFYLLNCKSDLAVAFVDGLPVFVKKPGCLFKMKIFSTAASIHQVCLSEALSDRLGDTSDINVFRNPVEDQIARHVNILIENIALTILHEVSDANDNVPLLRVCIINVQCILQILYSKTRLITNFKTLIENYECSNNIWREVASPVEIYIFCRSTANLEVRKRRVPFHFYCRIQKIEVSLCQLSLDIVLFLVGKLGLAGPYAVRHSVLLGNCCKVKNFSGANLLCRVENHDTIIAANQSTSIMLRPVSQTKKNPDDITSISLQLMLGDFFTSPICISRLSADRRAWRMRLASHDASRTFPGPFVVVETSKKSEDGLAIAVYPMLKIHNESGLSLELRCRRPQETEDEFATVLLQTGDVIDDTVAAFESLNMSGLTKKALTSLSLGNFLLSVRPKASEVSEGCSDLVSVEWSEDLKGGKPVCLSGLFDKLNYQLKKGLGGKSVKASFSTIKCCVQSQGINVSNIHFLVQSIGRDVPVFRHPKVSSVSELSTSPVAVQEQKEIFLLPTIQVYNVLQSEILVMLSENFQDNDKSSLHIGRQVTIGSGSRACFYVNPSILYFTFVLTEFSLKCKPINSSDMVKKLSKSTSEFRYLDTELDFGGGKFIANLRLSRGDRGTLEATIFTSSILRNNTDLSFFCCDANNKSISREETSRYWSTCSPEIGFVLHPGSTASWFFRSNKVRLLWLKDKVFEAMLDLNALSGFTEIGSEVLSDIGVKHIMKFGISLKPILSKVVVPSRLVHIVPRYVVFNESDEDIFVQQSYVHSGNADGVKAISSNQKSALEIQSLGRKREIGIFDAMFRVHSNGDDDSLFFIQFCLKQDEWSWSGPICVTSLGHFFLKFRRKLPVSGSDQPDYKTQPDNNSTKIGIVDIVEEESMLVMHLRLPSNVTLPYRIENHLHDAAITYYQKGVIDPETLESGRIVGYVWDDLSLPHTLIVRIADMHLEREINIDKLSTWKPFYKVRQTNGLLLHSPHGGVKDRKRGRYEASPSVAGVFRLGYKVYADGSQRVLRISELVDNADGTHSFLRHSTAHKKFDFRVSFFSIRLLEDQNQDVGEHEALDYSAFLHARIDNVYVGCLFANHLSLSQLRVQSLNVDDKWQGAPFAAMLRKSQLDNNDMNDHILSIVIIFHSGNSSITEVKYCSIVVQPLDLNLDEETMMKLVPFWRTSLSGPNTGRQQIYFKHFEIHPVKIMASFIPGNSSMSYTTSQEFLRSLLHSVIKIPTVKAAVVELNGILLTHALLTTRELFIKCMQHYSWYTMRAVYIAKGSSLLPPSFASIFDDSALSSLDVFFDPSSGVHHLPGLTVGMFKLIRKYIDSKGISGTKRCLGDLGKTLKRAGSNVLFATITEISDSVLKGADTSGFSGMVKGFHQGILNLAMEPTLIGSAFMEEGPNRRIKLDHSPGINEAYVEGYLQAMLDVLYKQQYLKVKVIDDQVLLKNLPPNSYLINDIVERVKNFLISEGLLKGESNASSLSLRRLYGGHEWKFGPMMLTLSEHLFVSFAIRFLRKQANKVIDHVRWRRRFKDVAAVPVSPNENQKEASRKQALGTFVLSSVLAYIDGRLCRCIPNTIARRIVSGFLLSFLDQNDKK